MIQKSGLSYSEKINTKHVIRTMEDIAKHIFNLKVGHVLFMFNLYTRGCNNSRTTLSSVLEGVQDL